MAKIQKSITDEICDYLKKQKLSPIPVQTLNEDAETTRYFGGDLKEFIAAAKLLGAKGIFVEELYLEDDEFYYDSGMDDDEYMALYGNENVECQCGGDCKCKKGKKKAKDDDSDVDAVYFEPEDLDGLDLTLLKPQMAKYLDRIGERPAAVASAKPAAHASRFQVSTTSKWKSSPTGTTNSPNSWTKLPKQSKSTRPTLSARHSPSSKPKRRPQRLQLQSPRAQRRLPPTRPRRARSNRAPKANV